MTNQNQDLEQRAQPRSFGTHVTYFRSNGGEGGSKIDLGYCTESQQNVFKALYPKFAIYSYNRFRQPVDCYYEFDSGLEIESCLPPRGCEIRGNVKDIEQNIADYSEQLSEEHRAYYAIKQRTRDDTYFLKNLKARIIMHLGKDFVYSEIRQLLHPSGERLNPKIRDYRTLLEVAGIVLRRKNPDAKLLQQILENY